MHSHGHSPGGGPRLGVTSAFLVLLVLVFPEQGNALNPYQLSDWDDPFLFACKEGELLSYWQSFHNNRYEDRRFAFGCQGKGAKNSVFKAFNPTWTNWDKTWDYQCNAGAGMTGIQSRHDNRKEDRVWRFRCSYRLPHIRTAQCSSSLSYSTSRTGLINGVYQGHQLWNQWDKTFWIRWGPEYYINSIFSTHNNRYEDRLWSFNVCRISGCDAGFTYVKNDQMCLCGDGSNKYLETSTSCTKCTSKYRDCETCDTGGCLSCTRSSLTLDRTFGCIDCPKQFANCKKCRINGCTECEGSYAARAGWMVYYPYSLAGGCREMCSHWRSPEKVCYPGTCSSYGSTCQCAPGFSGAGCVQVSKSVVPTGCFVTVDGITNLASFCKPGASPPTTSIFVKTARSAKIQFNLNGLGISPPLSQYRIYPQDSTSWGSFIRVVKIGVADSGLVLLRRLFGASSFSQVSAGKITCSRQHSAADPLTSATSCQSTLSVSSYMRDGDTLKVLVHASPGGYIEYYNRDTRGQSRRYYKDVSRPTHAREILFQLDSSNPYVCNEDKARAMVVTSGRITKSPNVVVTMQNFRDKVSGIARYRGYVYRMKPDASSGTLLEEHSATRSETKVPAKKSRSRCSSSHPAEAQGPTAPHQFRFSLSGRPAGLYSIQAVFEDGAHSTQPNHVAARRLVLYLPSSRLVSAGSLTLPAGFEPPQLAGHPKELWLAQTRFTVDYSDNFYNDHLNRRDNWLNRVQPFRNHRYDASLDQTSGTLPISGTSHHKGITSFYGKLDTSRAGPPSATSMPSRGLQTSFSVNGLSAGVQYRISVGAVDIMGNSASMSAYFATDPSPPRISDLGIESDGVKGLTAVASADATKLGVTFAVDDYESGLLEIRWFLTKSRVITPASTLLEEALPAALNNCGAPRCFCLSGDRSRCQQRIYEIPFKSHRTAADIDLGHGDELFVTVKARNRAGKWAEQQVSIAFDLSPPTAGAVFDNTRGGKDLDFVDSGSNLAAWFDGFTDPESGLHRYAYIIGPACASAAAFASPTGTASPSAPFVRYSRGGPGPYVVSVVAFNKANSMSAVVCSDGITIDSTPPTIGEISADHVYVVPGFLQPASATGLFYLFSNGTKVALTKLQVGATLSGCRLDPSNVRTDPRAAIVPSAKAFNGIDDLVLTKEQEVSLCKHHQMPAGSTYRHYVPGSRLSVAFQGGDAESEIREFYLGVVSFAAAGGGSAPSFAPDLKAWTATHRRQHQVLRDVALEEGVSFFVAVKAVNNAGLEEVATAGPFVVDSYAPPAAGGTITAKATYSAGGGNTLNAVITVSSFGRNTDCTWQVAVGNSAAPQLIRAFLTRQPLGGGGCSLFGDVLTCKALGGDAFAGLSIGNSYLVSVRCLYPNGQATVASKEYVHRDPSPAAGTVSDVNPADLTGLFAAGKPCCNEMDFAVLPTHYGVLWSGFATGTSAALAVVVKKGDAVLFSANVPDIDPSGGYRIFPLPSQARVDGAVATGTVTVGGGLKDGVASSDGLRFVAPQAPSGGMAVCVGGSTFADCSAAGSLPHLRSTSSVSASWSAAGQTYVSLYKWSIVSDDGIEAEGTAISHSLGVTASHLDLKSSVKYRFRVHACTAGGGCLTPVDSPQFYVVTQPPQPGSATASIDETLVKISASWSAFATGSGDVLQRYSYTVSTSANGEVSLSNWLDTTSSSVEMIDGATKWKAAIEEGHDLFVVVRGFGGSGLSAQTAARVDVPPSVANGASKVLDGTQGFANQRDVDHTSSRKLYASWPTLNGSYYRYAVSRDPRWQCDIMCQYTSAQAAETPTLDLAPGTSYYFCVESNTGEKACSDGVRYEDTPMRVGKVSFHAQGTAQANAQAVTDVVALSWEAFTSPYPGPDTAAQYAYCLGEERGTCGTVAWRPAGHSLDAVLSNLDLSTGVVYYASVRCTSLAGLQSVATSEGLMVDATPPSPTSVHHLDLEDTNNDGVIDTLTATWSPYEDGETGIAEVWWGVGSQPHHVDLAPFQRAGDRGGSRNGLSILQGTPLFVTVKAINGAGGVTSTSSAAFPGDISPPVAGSVAEVEGASSDDVDFQLSSSTISTVWSGFSEPDSAILSYEWCVGTKRGGCEARGFENVGLATRVTDRALAMDSGTTYFVTVRACNTVNLCVEKAGDGVTVDDSPPVLGVVFDGLGGREVTFQGVDSIVQAHWAGFHDPQSHIARYLWCAGSGPSKCEYVAWTDVQLRDEGFFTLENKLPAGRRIRISVKAVNGAGLSTVGVSNGFVVDITPPQVDSAPVIVSAQRTWKYTGRGGASSTAAMPANTQQDPSTIRVSWDVTDSESGIGASAWSLTAHNQADPEVYFEDVGGLSEGFAAGLDIGSGDTVVALVTVCNGARLCTSVKSAGVLVDYTPPVGGSIDHFHSVSGASGASPTLSLTFEGFVDPESGVAAYEITVAGGSLYGAGAHLFTGSYGHAGGASARQVVNVKASLPKALTSYPSLYLIITAVNGVGTRGMPLRVEVAVKGATLEVVRAGCQPQDCAGLCTCSPPHEPCGIDGVFSSCSSASSAPPGGDVVVRSGIDGASTSAVNTASTRLLSAVWNEKSSPTTLRYEITAGSGGPGSGLFNPATDFVWLDRGVDKYGSVHFPQGRAMANGQQYQFFVKAYLSPSAYRITKSAAFIVDATPPLLNPKASVIDVGSDGRLVDVDFVGPVESLKADWTGLFQDAQSGIASYLVALGTSPGSNDAADWVRTTSTSHTFDGLTLAHGVFYHWTVHAFNKAGLSTFAFSDGLTTEQTPPTAGQVRHGSYFVHRGFADGSEPILATWNGFFDPESSIRAYAWGVGTTPSSADIIPMQAVGLSLEARSQKLAREYGIGGKFYIIVRAENGFGQATTAASPAIRIDASPPVGFSCELGPSLVPDGSFEAGGSGGWSGDAASERAEATGDAPAHEGHWYYMLSHRVTRSVSGLVPGKEHLLSFYAAAYGDHSSHTVIVTDPSGATRAFPVHQARDRKWQRFQLTFVPAGSTGSLVFTTSSPTGVGLDLVDIKACSTSASATDVFVLDGRYFSSPNHIRVSWTVDDAESGISSFQWAVGTKPGGQQIVPYTHVGTATFGETHLAALIHGHKLYASVLAHNGAGRHTVFKSPTAIVVDQTPPSLGHVYETKSGSDPEEAWVARLGGKLSVVAAAVSDAESGIARCEHAVGRALGGSDVASFGGMSFDGDTGLWARALDVPAVVSGTRLFSTVRCTNNAGLATHASSKGVLVVASLTAADWKVRVATPSPVNVARAAGYQAVSNALTVVWDASTASVGSFELQVFAGSRSGASVLKERVGLARSYAVAEQSLPVGKQLLVVVTAVYEDGSAVPESEQGVAQLFVDATPPTLNSAARVTATRAADGYNIDWTGLFQDGESSLRYDVSLGRFPKSASISQWVSTTAQSAQVKSEREVAQMYAVVQAINQAGLSSTHVAKVVG